MGGFGAIHTALAYPQTFGTAIGLSFANIINKISRMKPGDPDSHANYECYRECFGDLEKVKESENNPEIQIKRLLANGEKLPELYMASCKVDFLLENDREFPRFQDTKFWDKCVQKFIPEIFG